MIFHFRVNEVSFAGTCYLRLQVGNKAAVYCESRLLLYEAFLSGQARLNSIIRVLLVHIFGYDPLSHPM